MDQLAMILGGHPPVIQSRVPWMKRHTGPLYCSQYEGENTNCALKSYAENKIKTDEFIDSDHCYHTAL